MNHSPGIHNQWIVVARLFDLIRIQILELILCQGHARHHHHGESEASECERATLHKHFSFGRPGAGGVSETAVQSRLGHTFADPRSQDATWTKSSICHHTVTTLHSYSLPNMPMRKEKKRGTLAELQITSR